MPTLVLENVPPELYDRLQELAAASKRPVGVEAVAQLETLLLKASPHPNGPVAARPPDAGMRLPDGPFFTEEMSAPFDLPRPGKGFPVTFREGSKFLPKPHDLPEEQSE